MSENSEDYPGGDRTEKTPTFRKKVGGVLKSIVVNIVIEAVKALVSHFFDNPDIINMFS